MVKMWLLNFVIAFNHEVHRLVVSLFCMPEEIGLRNLSVTQ